MEGGHREDALPTFKSFRSGTGSELMPKAASNDFISVPIRNIQGEYMVVRPSGLWRFV